MDNTQPASRAAWQRPPAFVVELEFFSGPMDLLLHLVHQKEVPIEQVEMREICEQYLEIISQAAVLDLERATEYLVVAATLISLKSQSLLPSGGIDAESGAEDWFDARFYESLRERLKAYELTKLRAHELLARPQLGLDTFARRPGAAAEVQDEFLVAEEESQWLGELFTGLLKRVGEIGRKFIVRLEPVSVVSLMMKFVDRLKVRSKAPESFLSMIGSVAGRENSKGLYRAHVVGGFIAVLELTKRGLLCLQQDRTTNDFTVQLHFAEDGSPVTTESFADVEQDDRVIHLDKYRAQPESGSPIPKAEAGGG